MPVHRAHAHVAAAELGRLQRHACAVFDDAASARSAIDDFVLEGLRAGEKVTEIAEDPRTAVDGLASRTDVLEALGSGQLEVLPWTDAYLVDGTFRATRMLAFVRRRLREVDTDRFAGGRLIGAMDWAVESLDGVDELLEYEAGVNRILARPRVTVLCVYDAHRHPAERLEALKAVHDRTVINGAPVDVARPRPSPRERILEAAALLFAENGVARTGVDTLIEAAGVAKATFYRHFPSKDDLVVAWLEAPATRWYDAVRATAMHRATSPREVVPQFFEAVAEWLEAEDFVGCPYLTTAVDLADSPTAAADAIRRRLEDIYEWLERTIAATGHPDPKSAARAVHALVAGAITLGVATRSSAPALSARDAAVQLLDHSR